jgi:hypothetical protein
MNHIFYTILFLYREQAAFSLFQHILGVSALGYYNPVFFLEKGY